MPGASADAQTGFAFATIDSRDGSLRYARTGAYPRIVISSSRTVLSETLAPVRGRALPLVQGSAVIAAGDHVLLFTDGIGRKLSADGKGEAGRTLAKMAAEHHDAENLSRSVLAASRCEEAPDDLTIVVIRVESVGQPALEVVA
jgi:serine phosphatase RsbU (regulator of sigma subunit)